MIYRYQVLMRRIELEIEALERTQATIQKHWQSALKTTTDQDAYLNSVALNLHSLYSGLERMFELIAVELDGGVLGGEAWHTECSKCLWMYPTYARLCFKRIQQCVWTSIASSDTAFVTSMPPT